MSNVTDGSATDWRGTPIVPGALVVYGAPVGRSIAMVEGTVDSFTKSGRVNVKIIRRSYGGYSQGKEIVHVGQDRLTIVTELPPTDKITDKEKFAAQKAKSEEHDRVYRTHQFPGYSYAYASTAPRIPWGEQVCTKCDRSYNLVMRDAAGAPVECSRA